MCLDAFASCLGTARRDQEDRSASHRAQQQLLLPKSALIKCNSRPLYRDTKRVAFMPTLQDVQDSLSRKKSRASLSSLSDCATMGTVDFDYETASFSFNNISLLAEAGSSVCGSSINNVSPVRMTKQTSISHMRNVSDTAVFGDETPTSEKGPLPWTSEDSGPYTGCAPSYQISTLDRSTTTRSFSSPHSFAGKIIGSHNSELIDAPARSSQADKVSDREVLFQCLSSPTNNDETCVQSGNHVSHDQMQTVADRYERVGKLVPADSTTCSRDLSSTSDNSPCAPGVVDAPPRTSGAHKLDQDHRCCIGVLSAFEEKYLDDEDKKAIVEGGCHGLCTSPATFSGKRSPGRKASRANRAQVSLPPALLERKKDELFEASSTVKIRIIDANEALNSFKYGKTGGTIVPLAIVVACVVEQPPYKIKPAAALGEGGEHRLRRRKRYANLRAQNAV